MSCWLVAFSSRTASSIQREPRPLLDGALLFLRCRRILPLPEAGVAVNRPVAARSEGDGGLLAALGAGHLVPLPGCSGARSVGGTLARLLGLRPSLFPGGLTNWC